MKLRTNFCRQVSAPNWLKAASFCLAVSLIAGCSEKPAIERADRPGALTPAPQADHQTALDEYVAAPDTNYNFRLVDTLKASGYTTFVLEMTSQAWLTTNEVDRPLWKHWVNIVRPDTVQSATAQTSSSAESWAQARHGRDTTGRTPARALSRLWREAAA